MEEHWGLMEYGGFGGNNMGSYGGALREGTHYTPNDGTQRWLRINQAILSVCFQGSGFQISFLAYPIANSN